MRIYEFGKENRKVLLMFHGSCMTWNMFEKSIRQLSKKYHVIMPALPGHDPECWGTFTSVEQIAEEIEKELLKRGCYKIHGIYGLSMGGSIVVRMLANNRISVKYAIIDGGITPYQLPYIITRLISVRNYLAVRMIMELMKLKKFSKKGESVFFLKYHFSRRTIWRALDSCNNYSMPEVIPNIDTEIVYWYGEREKPTRMRDMHYIRKIYPKTKFRKLAGMQHAEYCVVYPERFAADIDKVLNSD